MRENFKLFGHEMIGAIILPKKFITEEKIPHGKINTLFALLKI